MMKRLFTILVLGAALGGCQTIKAANMAASPVGTTAVDLQKAAYATKLGFEATLVLATAYIERPRCGRPTSPILCSNQDVVNTMRKAIVSTDAGVQAAENAARTTGPDTTIAAALVTAAMQSQTAFKLITDANTK
jgi:hypothetical protein